MQVVPTCLASPSPGCPVPASCTQSTSACTNNQENHQALRVWWAGGERKVREGRLR